jgi:YbbR domain-containing protein
VTLDIPIVKDLPLQVDWVGKLAENLILEAVELEPDRITVIGGSKILEAISTMYTEKVALDSLRASGNMMVKVALTPASLKVGGDSKDRLSISYVIRKREPIGN